MPNKRFFNHNKAGNNSGAVLLTIGTFTIMVVTRAATLCSSLWLGLAPCFERLEERGLRSARFPPRCFSVRRLGKAQALSRAVKSTNGSQLASSRPSEARAGNAKRVAFQCVTIPDNACGVSGMTIRLIRLAQFSSAAKSLSKLLRYPIQSRCPDLSANGATMARPRSNMRRASALSPRRT